ncbi:MAG: RecX family transcriptional regulator [Clostridia bacterium]|nr:RecX family transcriptional regulator [Clostridia bacterium]
MSKTYMVEIQGKGKHKELWINDAYICPLNDFLILKYKLHNGDMEIIDLAEIIDDCANTIGFEKAVDYIAKGMKTTRQVRDYLKDDIYSRVIDQIVDKLNDYGYLDDTKYAHMFIEQNGKKYGKNKLKMQLINKGISSSVVREVLEEFSSGETLINYASKFMKNKEINQQNLAKLSRHLYSKGFTYEEIKQAISKIKGGEDESWY